MNIGLSMHSRAFRFLFDVPRCCQISVERIAMSIDRGSHNVPIRKEFRGRRGAQGVLDWADLSTLNPRSLVSPVYFWELDPPLPRSSVICLWPEHVCSIHVLYLEVQVRSLDQLQPSRQIFLLFPTTFWWLLSAESATLFVTRQCRAFRPWVGTFMCK